jgi:hypothetical protein
MRLFALVALMLIGCDPGATAAPLAPHAFAVSSFGGADLQLARWRHRHREGFWAWSQTEGGDRADTSGSSEPRSRIPEAARPAPRRRGDWVDPPPLK